MEKNEGGEASRTETKMEQAESPGVPLDLRGLIGPMGGAVAGLCE